jgi:hexosaminidase
MVYTYSMRDVSDLTVYARDRGVMLIVEVDVPGHAASWTKGKPSVMAQCFEKYNNDINDLSLNPAKEETYRVLANVLKDLVEATDLAPTDHGQAKGQVKGQGGQGRQGRQGVQGVQGAQAEVGAPLHLGGDEVVYGCWAEDPSIVTFMDQQGFTSYDQLMAYFVTRADAIASSLGRRYVCNMYHNNRHNYTPYTH